MLESVYFIPAFAGSPWLGLGKHGGIKVLQIFSFGAEQPHSSLLQSSTIKLSKNHKIINVPLHVQYCLNCTDFQWITMLQHITTMNQWTMPYPPHLSPRAIRALLSLSSPREANSSQEEKADRSKWAPVWVRAPVASFCNGKNICKQQVLSQNHTNSQLL